DLYNPAAGAGTQTIFDFDPTKPTKDNRYLIPKQMNYHQSGKTSFEAVCSQIESAYDVQSSFSQSVEISGGFWSFSFSASHSYQDAQKQTGNYKSVQLMTHSAAELWILNQIDDEPLPLSDEFINDVSKLPLSYDDKASKAVYQK